VISVEHATSPFRPWSVRFHELPRIAREQIVLPHGVLERVESHTIAFARQTDRLRAAGRHLRRGLLLHGPPGTGKTMTAMYVVGQLPGRTVILLTGGAIAAIEQSVGLARMLEPSLVLLEDVDLVAEERTRQGAGRNAVLFELLNQMDGLTEDADIVFVLTTNRADLLEPALAARPGRIDQAVEVPLPDSDCRRRLFELYAEGLRLEVDDLERFVDRTRGVSAAFIRELLRKAALRAADESEGDLVVGERHLDEALHDLVIEGGELTKTLLGGTPAPVT
jgi:ATP-dependent 26S proteasome regulatory subunit